MKRSEAIISLSNKLQKSQNLLDEYKKGSIDLKCLCDNLATRVIDYCENEIGMLPPPSGTDPVTSSLLYCYYPEVVEKEDNGMWFFDRDSSILWELEDEKE